MLLTMKTIYADVGGLVLQPGQSHDFPDDEAQALLAGGFAEDVAAMEAAAEKKRADARAAKLAAAGDQAPTSSEAGAKVVTPKGGKGGGKGSKPAADAAG